MIADLPLFHQPDSAFFRKAVPIEQISFKLLSGREGPGIHLAGPKAWDAAAHPTMPLAMVWKMVSGAEDPAQSGHLIFSEASGKTSFAVPLNDYSGKVPMAEDGKASEPASEKPAGTPGAAEAQHSAGNLWYGLAASALPGGPGTWTAVLLSAGTVSNPHAFTVKNKPAAAPAPQDPDSLLNSSEGFGKRSAHPAAPKSGVAFKVSAGDGGKGSLLLGSYALPSRFASANGMLLTAYVSGKETADVRTWRIRIPSGKTKRAKNLWTGNFTLDLEARLKNPQLPDFEMPKGLFVTFVVGDYISQPRPLAPK